MQSTTLSYCKDSRTNDVTCAISTPSPTPSPDSFTYYYATGDSCEDTSGGSIISDMDECRVAGTSLFESDYRDCTKNKNLCWGDDRNNANKWAQAGQQLVAPREYEKDRFNRLLYQIRPNGCSQFKVPTYGLDSVPDPGQFMLNWQNSPDSPAKCRQEFDSTRCICKRPA